MAELRVYVVPDLPLLLAPDVYTLSPRYQTRPWFRNFHTRRGNQAALRLGVSAGAVGAELQQMQKNREYMDKISPDDTDE